MVPHEDEVPLIMECDHPATVELGYLWEPRPQHPCHCVTQTSGEIVQNNLWLVIGHLSMALKKRHREFAILKMKSVVLTSKSVLTLMSYPLLKLVSLK